MRPIIAFLLLCLIAVVPCNCAPVVNGIPDNILSEMSGVKPLPAGTYKADFSWESDGPHVGHECGAKVSDAEASGGFSWEVIPGRDKHGTALFGPYYEQLEKGDYLAIIRLKIMTDIQEDSIAMLDAVTSYGSELLNGIELLGGQNPVGKYFRVAMPIRYIGGKLECRLNWYGYTPLRIDNVSLFKLTDGSFDQSTWRVAEAKPSGQPSGIVPVEEPRPFPDVFPVSAPCAKQLVVCDLGTTLPDERLMTYCLQGLVNRTQPRVFVISNNLDRFWLKNMLERGLIDKASADITPQQLFEQFRDLVKGVVITDSALPATRNIATMLASTEDALPVSSRLAKQLNLPVVADLRGRWKTNVQAYEWAFENLWPKLNHHVMACSWPDHLGLRDYLYQHKIFIFWLSGALDGCQPYANPTAEAEMMEKILAKVSVNIPIMSYPWAGKDIGIGEGPGVSLFAEFGKYLVGSIDCTNISIHSGFRIAEFKQKPAPPTPKLNPEKIYISYIMSDGDNLPVLTLNNFPQLWKDKTRGTIPIGWTLCPSAHVLLPDVVDYYLRTATPDDHFQGAVSGVGYTYPDLYGKRFKAPYRQQVYDGFLQQTGEYMKRSDLQHCWIMNASRPEVIARYAEIIPELEGLFPDYGRQKLGYEDATYLTARNVPVFHAVTGWRPDATREERIAGMVLDVQKFTPNTRPAFMHVFLLNWFMDLPMLVEVAKRLGPEYEVVRPDHLSDLMMEHVKAQKLLVKLPAIAAAIEGQPLFLEGRIRNAVDEPVSFDAQIKSGLTGSNLSVGSNLLQPTEETKITLSGKPVGDEITVNLNGAFGDRKTVVPLQRILASELLAPLNLTKTLIPALWLEAEDLPHRSGDKVVQKNAFGSAYWQAKRGVADPGFIVFGPYTNLEAGNYLAAFRVRRTSAGSRVIADLDAAQAGGQPGTQNAHRTLTGSELPKNEWRWVTFPFTHPGGQVETRVNWTGSAGLDVDAIAVWNLR